MSRRAIPITYSRTRAPNITQCDLIRQLRDTVRDSEKKGLLPKAGRGWEQPPGVGASAAGSVRPEPEKSRLFGRSRSLRRIVSVCSALSELQGYYGNNSS